MDYLVTTGLVPPMETSELDALQREGVAALLDRQLAQVEGVAGPEEDDIDVLDYRISTHPDSVTVVLAVEAPTLATAEEAASTVLGEVVGDSELLSRWTINESEVRITEDEFNQSLAAADEVEPTVEAPKAELETTIEEVLDDPSEPEPEVDSQRWREKLMKAAEQLRAFDYTSAFDSRGVSTEGTDNARLAAGALIHAVRVITDEMFYDELALAVNNTTVDKAVGMLVLDELPPCYRHHYDSLFTRGFLLASAAISTRLAEPQWTPPRCVAEALALRLVMNEARVLLEAAELLSSDHSEPLFAAFASKAFTNTDHEELYQVEDGSLAEDSDAAGEVITKLRGRGIAFEQWFQPNEVQADGGATGLHPYLRSYF